MRRPGIAPIDGGSLRRPPAPMSGPESPVRRLMAEPTPVDRDDLRLHLHVLLAPGGLGNGDAVFDDQAEVPSLIGPEGLAELLPAQLAAVDDHVVGHARVAGVVPDQAPPRLVGFGQTPPGAM